MKRKITCTLIAAFVIGVAGNAFAAANPFEDVPSEHWSYDALAYLSQDGVLKGFGDGTFRGDRRTSRYEMAQLVAAVMARTDLTAMQKIIVERLVAEYKVELDLLGVRVSNLEKHADRVKWNGTVRLRYKNRLEQDEALMERKKLLYLTLRLEPVMEINEHWKAKARIDGHFDMKKDLFATEANRYTTESNQTMATQDMPTSGIKRAYIEGNYDNFQILLGKIPYKTITDGGMIHDEAISGAQITFGNKVKATLTAGRSRHFDSVVEQDALLPITGTYYGAEVYNDRTERFTWGLAYHHWANQNALWTEIGASGINIYEAGLGYKFDKNFSVNGAFAWTKSPAGEHENVIGASSDPVSAGAKRAYSLELRYKGANPLHKGSFGLFLAYRHLGHYAAIVPTYDAMPYGHRGFELGGDYVFDKNIVGTVKFYTGKKMPDEDGIGEMLQQENVIFGELNFFF